MKYDLAPDIKTQIDYLIEKVEFTHVQKERIFCIRSIDAKTRAIARIWGFSKIFVEVAGMLPTYIIEVNHRRYDKLPTREKTKVLIHELMHIPMTFSGALRSHKGRGFAINDREVEKICARYGI
jgi:predicted metallopeptidase